MFFLFLLIFLAAGSPVLGQVTGAEPPVVKFDPPCPVRPEPPWKPGQVGTIPVLVRYNPAAPGAKLTAPKSLQLELAVNQEGWPQNARTIPMTRAVDGTWQATIPFERYWDFLLLYVRDERNVLDQNSGRYWEMLSCGPDETPSRNAIEFQATSYTGRQLRDGVQRDTDYARAVSILEADLARHPDRIREMWNIWVYRARQGGETAAAFAKVALDIDRFVDERRADEPAIALAAQFASSWRNRLPARTLEKARAALAALNSKSPILSEIVYDEARAEKDPGTRAALLAKFIEQYPDGPFTHAALVERFRTLSGASKDVAGTEQAFEAWRRSEPGVPDVYASMGRFYVNQGIEPGRAVELLTRAIDLCRADAPPVRSESGWVLTAGCEPPDPANPAPGLARLEEDIARLRSYRGRALTDLGQFGGAIEDLQFAESVLTDEWNIAFALGQACEKAGRKDAACAAYLRAASAPHQTSPEPFDALVRVFVGGGMGTREALDGRLDAAVGARRKKVAGNFTPVPVDRAAPDFELTTLDGRRLTNASLKGRPVVLNFWATWCGPCIAEMPGFVELQRRNPGVAVIAVAVRSEPADIDAMVRARKWTAITVARSDAAGLAFGAEAVPRTCVLDKNGRLRFVHSGGLDDVVAVIDKELAIIAAEAPMSVDHIHWLGHASFRLDDGAAEIYIDPWKLPAGAPKADVILITHAHFDHFSPEDLAKIEKPTTVFVAPADVASKLPGQHVITAAPGGSYQAGTVKVAAVAAYNTNKDFHPKANRWVGYVVTLSNGQRIYHTGDSDVTPEMKQVQTDVALMPCGGTYTMTGAEVAAAANEFKPAVLIPMHWGDIVGARADAEAVAKAFKGKTVIRPVER